MLLCKPVTVSRELVADCFYKNNANCSPVSTISAAASNK